MSRFKLLGWWHRSRARNATAIVAVAILATVGAGLLGGNGASQVRFRLTNGQVWLASPRQGLVTLVDGASNEWVSVVRVAPGADELVVSQNGSGALVGRRSDGAVLSIDGAQMTATRTPYQVTPGSGLEVLVAGERAYVVDPVVGSAIVLKAADLSKVRDVPLGGRPRRDQLAVDSSSRLWAVDQDGSGARWWDTTGAHGPVAANGSDVLVKIDNQVALVAAGSTQRTINWIDADGTLHPWSCQMATRAGDTLQLLGAEESASCMQLTRNQGL